MLLTEILRRNVKKQPDKEAVVYGDVRLTYRMFQDRVFSISRAMAEMGLKKGERFAVYSQNNNQYAELYMAAAKSGRVLTPINFRYTPREVEYVLNNADAKILFFESQYAGVTKDVLPRTPTVEKLVCLDDASQGDEYYEDLIKRYPPDPPDEKLAEDDLVCLLYTSGSTGQPKGVMCTHKNLVANCINISWDVEFRSDDRTLLITPFYHVAPLWPMLCHFYVGGSVVVYRGFDPDGVLLITGREKITNINLVPTQLITMLEAYDPERHDISTLRTIIYAGAPMPVEVLKRGMKTFGPIFTQVYGLTEGTPMLTVLKKEEHVLEGDEKWVKRLASCGREIINVETRVVDENGSDVAPGQVGEIIGRGDNIMKGYWKLPEETKEALRDGWLYTGDLATVDEEGYIFIVDRKNFLIITGGENVYPKEVEEVIYKHPAVRECAVVGVPHPKWGETVKAIVVLKPGATATEEEIIELCKKHLASYKKPTSVEFWPELPKTSIGKIAKKEIRDRYWKK